MVMMADFKIRLFFFSFLFFFYSSVKKNEFGMVGVLL